MGRKRTIANVAEDANVAANDPLHRNPKRPSKRSRGPQAADLPTFSAAVSPSVTVATPPTRWSARIKVAKSSILAYVNAFGNEDSDLSDDGDTRTSSSTTLTDRPMSDSDGEEVAKPKKSHTQEEESTYRETPRREKKAGYRSRWRRRGRRVRGVSHSGEESENPRKRKLKVTEPIVYDIPDVEKRTTTFKGRLGYACLNTVFQNLTPFFVVGMVKGEIDQFHAMSSEIFPFASHAVYGYDLSFADKELKEAGELAKKYKHRLTMHPGQFTQLGSPKEEVVTASFRKLEYNILSTFLQDKSPNHGIHSILDQCEIMDRMGLDQNSVMIIHMRPSERPVTELIPKINETWKRKGIRAKQHLSEPRPGAVTVMEKRAHADKCKSLPAGLPDDADLMIDAKDKEQAVLELYRIYDLEGVIWENLRLPKKEQTLATNGEKNRKTGVTGADGTEVILKDVEKEGEKPAVVLPTGRSRMLIKGL
ncbi:hypothetical protein M407DRAFT_12562 [Tulasnella calospora MUT 4182]|uniref:Uncharacterized protein n=1 Tax=Tulasnella calospora MUT 4182 TaxID=1051891 RepID=A0A0C3PQU7_9AGAM|nr:hypothetical protein M407DRAFT_12562 [Tulasnella calospora MUT 4182]